MIYSVIDNTLVRCVYVGTSGGCVGGTASVKGFTEQIQGNVLTNAMKHKETMIHERFVQKKIFFGYVLEERQQKKREAKKMTDKKRLSDVKTKQRSSVM